MTTKVKEQLLAIISKHLDSVCDSTSIMQIGVNFKHGTIVLEDFRDSLGLSKIDIDSFKN